jgi:predicted dienelactone hydrolase
MDHSEIVAPELSGHGDETDNDRAIRIDNIISGRVPDVRFLLDHLFAVNATPAPDAGMPALDQSLVGLVGHSLGGWTVLSTAESDARIGAAVALAPGGSDRPMPGVLPLTLTFNRHRDVPTLFLTAANDTPIPLDRVIDVFDRTPGSKRMFVLARADHQHFVDAVEEEHEAMRAMSLAGPAAWIPAAMKPFAELASAEHAHVFVRGLTLAHLDGTLRALDSAERFLSMDVEAELAARGVGATRYGSADRSGEFASDR